MTDFWKNKKIIVYIALAHHTRFLSPVTREMASQGAEVRYVVGQAERSQEITAINLGLDYTHVFDYLTENDETEIQKNYTILRDTFTQALNTGFIYSATPVTVIDKTIFSTAMEYIGFKNLMEKEKPDLCLALHELNRWGKMFAFWAKKFKVPILTFQEGLYYGMDYGYTGHAQYSTLNLVWGERIRHKLTDFEAPPDRIVQVGNTHLSVEIAYQKQKDIRKSKREALGCSRDQVILLLFSGEIPSPAEFAPLFNTLSRIEGKKLFVKFHPAAKHDQVQQWIASIPEANRPHVKTFFGDENLYDLLSASDVCVLVQTSTTGLEALFFGKPLVQLSVGLKSRLPYSFTQLEVAAEMTPADFAKALEEGQDFKGLTDPEKVRIYLDSELSDTPNAVANVLKISESVLTAGGTPGPPPLRGGKETTRAWSIILVPAAGPDVLLAQLESVSTHSETAGDFEVILLEPDHLSEETARILDSLKGDLIRLRPETGENLAAMINRGARAASGETLVLMNTPLAPLSGWLDRLGEGVTQYGKKEILGARIWDQAGGLTHAGMLVDKNNGPVSAFIHMPRDFAPALKERPCLFLDQMLCVNRLFFLEAGGLEPRAGGYAFLDFCLRTTIAAKAQTKGETAPRCRYMPDACLTILEGDSGSSSGKKDCREAVWFYGRWQGDLWQDDDAFYEEENVSKVVLDTEKLTQSMTTLF